MALPQMGARSPFLTAEQAVKNPGSRFRRIMIGTDGAKDTGKTEFALSAPGPGRVICVDKGIDGMLGNPNAPITRRKDFLFRIVAAPMPSAAVQNEFTAYWKDLREGIYETCADPQVRTLVVDGDSDTWESQRMAEFGKLTQVPPHLYTSVNAARRAFYSRLWESGKIVICTNKIKKEYETVVDANGTPVQKDGKEQRAWTGEYERQGFPDQDYCFLIQLTHLYEPPVFDAAGVMTTGPQWGIRINKCKSNRILEGDELWGPQDCCFQGLMRHVYPKVPLSEWGY